MVSWTGIALARPRPGRDGMRSRLSTYLHPLAGRPLAWHTASALSGLQPPPERVFLVGGPELAPDLFGGLHPEVETRPAAVPAGWPTSGEIVGRAVVVDAAAAAVAPALPALLDAPEGSYLPSPDGRIAAAVLSADDLVFVLEHERALDDLAGRPGLRALAPRPESVLVSDRRSLALASRLVHDRLVHRLMEGGVTFLLPDSVLVDVDVRIGRDTIVYPGAVLEGQTIVGEETVIGPGCRIIDSWIGSGVELKGWNFISRSSIRNRAILEPYVRRGFD